MSTAARIKPYTFDDFCFLVADGQKADLIDGVIYIASPDNFDANQINLWLAGLMDDYAQAKNLGAVFISRVALRLDKKNGPEPDIGFIRRERKDRIKRGFIDGPADVVVEIVSPDSVDRDYIKKRAQYERYRVREYWIIDETKQTTTFLRLDKSGKYREVRLRNGEFHSKSLTDFWFRPEWLWARPRPLKFEMLQMILARSK